MAAPSCGACGSIFACINCSRTLRTQFSAMHEVDHLVMTGGSSSAGQYRRFFEAAKAQALYATSFPVGPRGGAMIDFGNAITLECYLPYKEDGELVLPLMPLPLIGSIVHDIGRKRRVSRAELERCVQGSCRCKSRPIGWRLTRPIVRAMLGVTDSWLNDHGRQLPGLITTSWALAYHTRTFMEQVYFANFLLPKREESREARAHRARSRSSAGWTHMHPEHARRRRR
ncbi:MAG TPA: hypothetical protein VGF28_27290 [Thermoanaerobaculia bacterium]